MNPLPCFFFFFSKHVKVQIPKALLTFHRPSMAGHWGMESKHKIFVSSLKREHNPEIIRQLINSTPSTFLQVWTSHHLYLSLITHCHFVKRQIIVWFADLWAMRLVMRCVMLLPRSVLTVIKVLIIVTVKRHKHPP